MGFKCGLCSTVCNYINGKAVPTECTTPDPIVWIDHCVNNPNEGQRVSVQKALRMATRNGYATTFDNGFDRTGAPWGKYYNTIQSVVIGNNVTSVGTNAFYGCKALTKVTIGKGVKTIGAGAFRGCVNLTSVSIPATVAIIGENAFYGDRKLKTIRIYSKKLKLLYHSKFVV